MRIAALHDDVVEATVGSGVVGHDEVATLFPDAVLPLARSTGAAGIVGVGPFEEDPVRIAEVRDRIGLAGIHVPGVARLEVEVVGTVIGTAGGVARVAGCLMAPRTFIGRASPQDGSSMPRIF